MLCLNRFYDKSKLQKVLALGIVSLMPISGFADCTFVVMNSSNYPVTLNLALGDKHENAVKVANSSTKTITIKSEYACITVSKAGLGVASIDLTQGKSFGGWIYSQDSNMIRAFGISNFNATGAIGYDSEGHELLLQHNFKPSRDKFNVIVSQAARNTSKYIGSSN